MIRESSPKGRYSEECGKQSSSGAPLTSIAFFFPTVEVHGAPKQPGYKLSSEYLPLCSAEQRHSYRFRTTWGWVNDDRISIFGWTIPLKSALQLHLDCFIFNPVLVASRAEIMKFVSLSKYIWTWLTVYYNIYLKLDMCVKWQQHNIQYLQLFTLLIWPKQ